MDRFVAVAVVGASRRAAAVTRARLTRRVDSLAMIASAAPGIGMFTTVIGIVNSFVGCGGERWSCLAAVVANLSAALVPMAAGLVVGIPADWCHRYLKAELAEIEDDMERCAYRLADLIG